MRIKSISRNMPAVCRQNRVREAQVAALGSVITDAALAAVKFPQYVAIDARGWVGIDAGATYYDIEGERITTPLELLEWVRHLSGKGWMTGEHVRQLIEVVCEARGWKLPDC